MKADKSIYQHYPKSERVFIEKVLDQLSWVVDHYSPYLTDFINPRQAQVIKALAAQSGVLTFDSADFWPMEYRRMILAPDYYICQPEDFELSLIEMTYLAKFNQLTHAQVLGNVLNQLGLRREQFGDILLDEGRVQLMMTSQTFPYLKEKLRKIGRASVKINELSFDQLMTEETDEKIEDCLVSSLRLDKVIASILKLSRQEAQDLISSGRVKVNYLVEEKPSILLSMEDMISIRGYGRCRLVSHNGWSKSGKIKISIAKMIHK